MSSTTTMNRIPDHGFVPADLLFKMESSPKEQLQNGSITKTTHRRVSVSKSRLHIQDQDIYYPLEDLKSPKSTANISQSYPEISKTKTSLQSIFNNFVKYVDISAAFKNLDSDTVKFILMCLFWYISSAITNNIGKQILNHFSYPLTLTWLQFGIVSAFCLLASFASKTPTITYPTKVILVTCLPLCLFQIVGHIFSSLAMARIHVSLVHTIKALSPLFTVLAYRLIWSIRYSSKVYLALVPLTLGVGMACINKVTWDQIGMLCALGSCLVYVAQSITTKKLLFKKDHSHDKNSSKLDKLNILFYSSILAFVLMFPMWLMTEGYKFLLPAPSSNPTDSNFQTSTTPEYSPTWLFTLFLLNGGSQYLQTIVSFSILAMTSAVTFTIASLFKRVFVILTAIFYFRQTVSNIQILGIVFTFIGLYLYDSAKREVSQLDQVAQMKQSSPPLLPTNSNEPTKLELDKLANNPSLCHRKHVQAI